MREAQTIKHCRYSFESSIHPFVHLRKYQWHCILFFLKIRRKNKVNKKLNLNLLGNYQKKKKRKLWLWNQVFFFFLERNDLTAKSWRQSFFLYCSFFSSYSCGTRQKIEDMKTMRNSIFFFCVPLNRRLLFKIIKQGVWWTGTDDKGVAVVALATCLFMMVSFYVLD